MRLLYCCTNKVVTIQTYLTSFEDDTYIHLPSKTKKNIETAAKYFFVIISQVIDNVLSRERGAGGRWEERRGIVTPMT